MENFQERRAQLSVEVLEHVTANPLTDIESGDVGGSKNKDLSKKGRLILAVAAFAFSFVSFFILKATNQQTLYLDEEQGYVFAIGIISTVYNGFQVASQLLHLTTGKSLFNERTTGFISFFGDQIIAYLLMSAVSSAVPYFYRIEGWFYIGVVSAWVSVSTTFAAFVSLALSAMISGYYKLSAQE
ncbi:hypothetical protein MKW98_020826 [Papaver atlanticum]|uniref:CASP-like protein n=1 Tax=Papaver atlanticum TaxID=357466 RepID=A0AAD4TFA7_9MAGN|nr:hypothetical protein MKW98_020826 [Papaver atlanticum]